ncbi:MAG TPA: outer membrane protein assembly factor BamA [Planctomycetota bacterium]|nr:outer membrane protein assembly factor BamA [Planctomycetota bacterium]HRR82878.1 outer membrane protein assembly factor BamA [Planctomycetota bacterium]HRT94554.1 outer membrane protein assembly factor BamA [Planctomycetota bacterium]
MNDQLRCLSRRGTLLALALLGLAARPAAAEQVLVREIVVRGYTGDAATITDIMRTKVGMPLDHNRLNDDLMALFRAGHMATYQLVTVPGGVRILVDISEGPRVRRIEIRGAGRDWGAKMKDEIVTRPNDPVSAAVLQQPEDQRYRGDKERIRAYCQQQGYRAVTVVSETTPVPNTNQIDLLFKVNLGPKYQVWWLRFQGNRSIRTRELRAQMQTKRDTFFTSRRYCDKVFEEDIVRLEDYCRYKGFPNAKVTYRRRFLGPQGNRVEITILVDEGQQFPVGTVEIKGATRFGQDTLLAAIPLKPAEIYSDQKLLDSRAIIERLYHENGCPDIAVSYTRQLNAAGDAFDVVITLDEGEVVRINTIRTRGHPRTRRDVILREMELEPGMLYSIEGLERSQRGVERLQFFDTVTMKLVPADPPAPGERDILVEVTEGRTGVFRFGIGASSTNGIVGTIEIVQRNFDWRDSPKSWSDLWSGNAYVGAGQTLRVSLMPGTVYSNYALAYDNPYWRRGGPNARDSEGLAGPQSFGWSVYHRTRDQGTWDESRTGLRVYRGLRKYKGDPDTDVTFHARLEAVNVSIHDEDDDFDPDEEAPDDAKDEKGTHPVFGAGVTVRRDRTDRPTFPTKGYEWEIGSELVVPHGVTLGGGGTKFWTLGTHPKGYERVISLRGRMDYEIGSFPIYERLYAGGQNLRGFAYRGASPHDNDEPIGGKYRALVSAEYRYPIAPPNFYGVFFTDAGTVTKDFTLFGDPRLAVGFGFRILVPALSNVPISVDFSAPLIKQSDDDTEFLYFSLSVGR